MPEPSSPAGCFSPDTPVVVIGAGPAGLTAAYELSQRGISTLVCEQGDQVGGLARTVRYKGFRFDIGGHRFFTKSEAVQQLWERVLGPDLVRCQRRSRIYYRRRFFDYPLRASNALRGLGVIESGRVLGSYIKAKLQPIDPEVSFSDWVTNRFGGRLYRMFFESYTRKVWGIPPHTIGAEWAAQRIKGLSLRKAILDMFVKSGRGGSGNGVRTLTGEFLYPRLGPGMMWERMAEHLERDGGRVRTGASVVGIHHANRRVTSIEIEGAAQRECIPTPHLISTMAVRDLVEALKPAAPPDVLAAARRLKYRDFLTVALILDAPDMFPDNWIYVHDAEVHVGRIQNFKNWSPEMVADPAFTCLGLEYFCTEGDELWSRSDEDLVLLATSELGWLGLSGGAKVVDAAVVRARKAYPVYDAGFRDALDIVRRYVDSFENLQLIGRNGMHKYNNQDHSMLTAILAVRNLYGEQNDLWALNDDDDYHESGPDPSTVNGRLKADLRATARTQPSVPRPLPKES